MRNIVVTWILGLVLLQALGCDCGSDLQEATSRADLYFVGNQPTISAHLPVNFVHCLGPRHMPCSAWACWP